MCDKCSNEYELDEVLHIPRFDISKEYVLEELNKSKKRGATNSLSSSQPVQLIKSIYNTLSPFAKVGFLENTPIAVINNLHIYKREIGNVDNREIKGSFNNSSLNIVNIQRDILREYQLSEKNFENLETDINKADISDTVREHNKLFLENLNTSSNEHDKEKVKK